MLLANLERNYALIKKMKAPKSSYIMEAAEKDYLRGLFVILCVTTKYPHFENMRKLWMQLPRTSFTQEVTSLLNSMFNPDTIELANLPPGIETDITEALLSGKPISWYEFAELALIDLIHTSTSSEETRQAHLALSWLTESSPALRNFDKPSFFLILTSKTRWT